MKASHASIGLAICSVLSIMSAFAQQSIDLVVFGEGKICEYNLPVRKFFELPGEFDKKFGYAGTIKAKFRGRCIDNRVEILENDTLIHLKNTVLELNFSISSAEHVFDTLSSLARRRFNGGGSSWLWSWDKGGKVYVLDKKSNSIQMISLNACSDDKKLDKIVDLLRGRKYYDKVLVIPCGAGVDSIISF